MRKILYTTEQINEIVKRLGKQFTEKFKDEELPPVFIGVLKGAMPFMMDLVREIDCPLIMDFIQVKSYIGTESTGVITLKKDISEDIKNRSVVIVEDIADSGYTLVWLKNYLLKTYKPKALYTCALLDKKCKRKVPFDVDYVGDEIGDYFIVGYGLDYDEIGRNVKEIFVPDLEEQQILHEIAHRK